MDCCVAITAFVVSARDVVSARESMAVDSYHEVAMRDTSGELLKESPPDPDSIDDKMVFYVWGLAWHLRIDCLGVPVLPVHFLTGTRDFTYTSEIAH